MQHIHIKRLIYYHASTLILQMSMSVNWRHIHAISMPAVLTQRAALTAHVVKVLKEMGSTVQVQYAFHASTYIHLMMI